MGKKTVFKYALVTICMVYAMLPKLGYADVITKCDKPSGYSFYLEGGLIKKSDAGWQKDGIANGSYLLIKESSGAYDIIYSDAMNRTMSSRGDGGQIVVISDSPVAKVILIIYPNMTVETWYFTFSEMRQGIVTVSQARYGDNTLANKHSLMSASCIK